MTTRYYVSARSRRRCMYCISYPCACRQCQDCGGCRPDNDLDAVHVCSSAWGEYADCLFTFAPVDGLYRGQIFADETTAATKPMRGAT